MKKNSVFLRLPAVLLALGLVLAACPSDADPDADADPGTSAKVATPTANPVAGTYASAQSVTLSCATSGATIYYTTDGSIPIVSSNRYSTPISIVATSTIKAIAVKSGMDNSDVLTAAYTMSSANIITYTVTADGSGTAGTTTLTFTFSGTVDGLTADNITITGGTGAAVKGTLSGSSLAITVSTGGTITVRINKTGVESGEKTVTVFKGDESARLIGKWYDSPVAANTAYKDPDYEFTADGKILIEGSDTYQARYSDLSGAAFTVSYSAGGTSGEAETTYSISGNRLILSGQIIDGTYYQNSTGAPINISWTAANRPFDSNININAVTWGETPGRFVAVGDKGKIAYSSDGTAWTPVETTVFGTSYNDLRSVAWGGPSGNKKFVAVGQNYAIGYSSDGITWTAATFPQASTYFNNYIQGVTWGGGKFYAVGNGNGLAYSSDGVNWTGTSSATFEVYRNGSIRGVAWGGSAGQEKFVAAGNNGSMGYCSNDDDWELTGNLLAYIGEDLNGVIWGGDKFLVFGAAGVLAYSSDGTGEDWTLSQSSGGFGGYSIGNKSYINDIAFGDGKFIAVGDDEETDYENKMIYSEDGINWTEIANADMLDGIFDGYSGVPQGIAYGNGKFVVVFSGNQIAYSN